MKRPVILTNLGRTVSGWEILHGHACETAEEMQEYCDTFGSDHFKVADLDTLDKADLEFKA